MSEIKVNSKYKSLLLTGVLIVLLIIMGQVLQPGFAKANNLMNILCKASVLAVACIGQAYVMISGNAGIDMSVGAVMSCAALLGPALSGGDNLGLVKSIAIMVIAAFLVGVINGVCIQKFKLPSLVVTLCMGKIIDGLTIGLTRGAPGTKIPNLLLKLGVPFIWKIRLATFVAVVLVVILYFVLNKSKYGKSLYLVGCNRNAARLAGINVDVKVITAYGISAVMAALAGYMLVGYVGSAQLYMADEYTMLSIAAVVIGGTKLSGGKGSLAGGALGAILLFLLTSILLAVGLNDGARIAIEGIVLLLIILANCREKKMRM
ncbi:MAG: ABC transporter permease [Lachnospiraceae bacterium]|nr:ABC transporter permease [Lachnospiraceae bacterium]